MGRAFAIGYPHQYEWLRTVLGAIFVMSALDGLLTIYWVSSGLATEANPLMAALLNLHPVAFMVAKLTLVAAGVLLLLRYRLKALSIVGSFALFLVYYYVIVYHLAAGFGA